MIEVVHVPKNRPDIQTFKTGNKSPIGIFVFLFVLFGFLYTKELFQNIPVMVLIIVGLTTAALLMNFYSVSIVSEGLYVQKNVGLFTRKAMFFPNEQIKKVSIILTLKVHYIILATSQESERIPLDTLIDYGEFLEIIKKKYAHVLKEHINTKAMPFRMGPN